MLVHVLVSERRYVIIIKKRKNDERIVRLSIKIRGGDKMQMTYQQAGLATTITYGEILTSSIQPAMYQDKAVIVITNQRYYDHFFEKIQGVFAETTVDWYICRNQLYANTLDEWMGLFQFHLVSLYHS